ncbi:MAG: c-type cytochrome [Nitrospira sp.]|nr:c-type cytochrome [Nitrospira sp.]
MRIVKRRDCGEARPAGSVILGIIMVSALLWWLPPAVSAGDEQQTRTLLQKSCAGCHRLEGAADSRFKLNAPDLTGAGSKFKREWLMSWLLGKEAPVYAKSYRWDQSQQPDRHPVVSQAEAEQIADYFEQHLKDPRVKEGAIDLSTFSAIEATFGEQLFKDHSCTGCHQIMVDGKPTGGPQSSSFVSSGRRLKADWIYRFNSNPPDFVPHSGEFVADVSELGLRYITGYIATRGWNEFTFYEPWTAEPFKKADVQRGAQVYQEYCAQCHGATGQGDGAAASGLEPKPAVHTKIAFDKLPNEYLYNVINYGGKAVGKSTLMPYWSLTLGQQGVADVMAYLRETFKGTAVAEATTGATGGPVGVCPQARTTKKAPAEFFKRTNPLPATPAHVRAGMKLYLETAKPLACMNCHGQQGDGAGPIGAALVPPPRNFTCGATMKPISDGQLFWVIKNGSPGTGMMAFPGLSDDETWQIVHYVRSLAR